MLNVLLPLANRRETWKLSKYGNARWKERLGRATLRLWTIDMQKLSEVE
jgi:hypothetical protein